MQEESDWMGPLALQMETAYRSGTARGERSQLSALGVSREEYFAAFGEAIDGLVLGHRENLKQRSHREATAAANQAVPPNRQTTSGAFQIARPRSDPKARWIASRPPRPTLIPVNAVDAELLRWFPRRPDLYPVRLNRQSDIEENVVSTNVYILLDHGFRYPAISSCSSPGR